MNQNQDINFNAPLLTYDAESNISQRNMSSLYFINYYKEPFYKETGGLITEMYIRAFNFGDSYLGMNYDPERMTEELAKEQTQLMNFQNCDFECSSVDNCSLKDSSQDFGYSLGVLHHIPNTLDALKSCSSKLKKGAPFLLYLYYRFDNKPSWFKATWAISDIARKIISNLPYSLKFVISQFIACSIYYPLARLAKLLEIFKINVSNFPLSEYRSKSFYIMRTDSLDRFGTRLEQRFTKKEIEEMLKDSGFEKISFSEKAPFWVSLAYKK